MTISNPEELYAFGVTPKDYDEKRSVLTKSTETEINENEIFWDLFQDLAEKAVNYEILQMLYWDIMASTDS